MTDRDTTDYATTTAADDLIVPHRGGKAYLDDLWADYGFDDDAGAESFDVDDPMRLIKSGRVGERMPGSAPGGPPVSAFRRRAGALIAAHDMVTSLVNVFANDLPYDVRFDPAVGTAMTDLTHRRVSISPAPVQDPTIDAPTAGTILTAMAVHEARCHATPEGSARTFAVDMHWDRWDPDRDYAALLDNLINDVRGEAEFAADYPGYAHVFEPALDYVARAGMARDGRLYVPRTKTEVVGCATRYPTYTDWTGLEDERDWWQSYMARAITAPTVDKHVDAVAEGVAHFKRQATPPPPPPPPTGKGEGGGKGPADPDRQDGPAGQGPTDPDKRADADRLTKALESAARYKQAADAAARSAAASAAMGCLTGAVEAAATANGAGPITDLDRIDAQAVIDLKDSLDIDPVTGEVGEVTDASRCRGTRQITPASDSAAAMIRNAFMRSRTGHADLDRGHKRGRCDNKGLYRIAMDDPRLFHRRQAESTGKYLIWLLVDQSGSMAGQETIDVIGLTKALASAARYMPTLRMEVFGWTSSNRVTPNSPSSWGAYRAWGTGEDLSKIDDLHRIAKSGTPDVAVLRWAGRAIRKVAARDETPVIILLSDGKGGLPYASDLVPAIRATGVRVVGVSIGAQNDARSGEAVYGRDFVPWQGSIVATARPLANVLTRLVTS